jgi:GNAT superfamily N-acetyltransferase
MYVEQEAYPMPFGIKASRLREILEAHIRSKTCIVCILKETGGVGKVLGVVVGHIVRFDGRFALNKGNAIGRITELYLLPEARRQGCAKALTDKVEIWMRDRGVSLIEAEILMGNTPAERFWGKIGFQPYKTVRYKEI